MAEESPGSLSFEERLRAYAQIYPDHGIREAIYRVDKGYAPWVGKDALTLAEAVLDAGIVQKHKARNTKINGIKDIRSLYEVGLKEAKDAYETVESWIQEGRMSKAEREQVDRDAAEIIASLTKGT